MINRLEAVELVRSFKTRTVVNRVSFSVEKGQVVGLLGPNGAGKTTSFYMVVGLLAPHSGRVLLNNKDITSLPLHKRARVGISYLPQNMSIFRKLTVADNLLAIMEIASIPSYKHAALLEDLLGKFRLHHVVNSFGAALSGGERRRVEIARSLITNPDFLLLDEPFAGIDPVTVQEIQKIIMQLKNEGLGVLITDHNVRETLGGCDTAYILSSGKIISSGDPQDVASDPVVRSSYLGENFTF